MLIQLKSDTGTTKNGVRPLLILETNENKYNMKIKFRIGNKKVKTLWLLFQFLFCIYFFVMAITEVYQSCSIDYTWTTLSIYVSGSEITCVLILMGLLLSFCTILSSMADFLSILACWVRYFTTKKNCAANHDTELDAK